MVLAGLIVAGVLLWNNRTTLADDFRLLGYTPPANVAALAKSIDFTPQGQRDFYVSHPAVDDKTTFNAACGSTEPGTTILGCYTNNSIYIYDVTDPRLSGVQQVTAAHETLHAAYSRLSSGDRDRVDAMLERQYDAMSGNADFNERFSVYNSLSQAEKLNELHSIFGTEVSGLSGELETYYKQYFANRSIVTGDYEAYESQFKVLQDQQTALKQQIDALKIQINTLEAGYESDRTALNNDIDAFNQRARSGGYASQSQFNRDRSALVVRSNALNQTADSINAKIDEYNNDINQYNQLSIQTQNLENSLNSNSVQSAPSV